MKLVDNKVSLEDIKTMAKEGFGEMVKAVVDIDKKVMVIDMELHADGEATLIKHGSSQNNLWGINIYPDLPEKTRIEYRSLINLKPTLGNTSLVIDDEKLKAVIEKIVNKLIDW